MTNLIDSKSLGAKNKFTQFYLKQLFCLIGGVIGLFFGLGYMLVLTNVLDFEFVLGM
jgi:hypothetical protein